MLTIGTRGSKLALWQANHIADRLRHAHQGLEVRLEIIKTSGDRIQDRKLYEVGGKGLFVKEIEEALMDKRIDLAVHSMKDVPGVMPEGLTLAAMTHRASAFDALISNGGAKLAELPKGARVGTGSLRRKFQLLIARPDLNVLAIRGNVDTRLDKLRRKVGGLQAIILAVSGLERLGMGDVISERLSSPAFLPAIGQGALGLETREGDTRVTDYLEPLRHRETEYCVHAERGVLERLEGDCHLPIACLGTLSADGTLMLQARLGLPDGSRVLEGVLTGSPSDARALGLKLGQQLLEQGGGELMAQLDEMVAHDDEAPL